MLTLAYVIRSAPVYVRGAPKDVTYNTPSMSMTASIGTTGRGVRNRVNAFQKQLILNDGRTLAQRHNDGPQLIPDAKWQLPPVELPPAPRRVSVVDFEKDMCAAQEKN